MQNFIAPAGRTIEEATFVPVSPELLPAALDEWEKYCHTDEKDPLVQLAVVKAQFELIHPFLDGNGRIGRMLAPIFLYEKKLLCEPMFYISAYFENNRDEYYRRLQNISREGDWNGWIDFFLGAVRGQAAENLKKANNISELHERMKRDVIEVTQSPKYAMTTLDALFDLPIFSGAAFKQLTGVQGTTAKRLLNKLIDAGIITELLRAQGNRPAWFMFNELIQFTGLEPFL